MPFSRRAVAHRRGRRGRQGADRLPRVGRGRLEHRRTQVPGTAGHWRIDCSVTMSALAPMFFGGHQQEGMRPGTESVALAVGMQTALELWQKEQDEHGRRLTALRDRFEAGLKAGRPGVIVHGEAVARLPQTSNIAFPGLEGQILLLALDMAGVACSVGAACASGSTELSPTLRAMGLPNDIVASSLRFSFGATTTEAQIDEAVARILCRLPGVGGVRRSTATNARTSGRRPRKQAVELPAARQNPAGDQLAVCDRRAR